MHTGQTGKIVDVAQAEFAQGGRVQVVVSLGFFQGEEGKALFEVALDRALVDVEFCGQLSGGKLFTLVEAAQNLREAVGQIVVVVGAVGRHGHSA